MGQERRVVGGALASKWDHRMLHVSAWFNEGVQLGDALGIASSAQVLSKVVMEAGRILQSNTTIFGLQLRIACSTCHGQLCHLSRDRTHKFRSQPLNDTHISHSVIQIPLHP